MNGPTGYNIRYRLKHADPQTVLRVSPSRKENARAAAVAIAVHWNREVEVWRSGDLIGYQRPRGDLPRAAEYWFFEHGTNVCKIVNARTGEIRNEICRQHDRSGVDRRL